MIIEMLASILRNSTRAAGVGFLGLLASPLLLSLDDLWIALFFFVLLFGRARLGRP